MNYVKYKVINIMQTGGGSIIPDINYNNELFIFTNFFSKSDFEKINNYVKDLKFKDDNRVKARKTLCLSPTKYKNLYNIIYKNSKLKNIISKINPEPYLEIPRFPMEYRIYPEGSSGMVWHTDTSLFSPDGIEVVLTIRNDSSSTFNWKEDNIIKSIKPQENTLALVLPGTVSHSVSGTKNGSRTILKFVIDFKNSKPKLNEYKRELKNCPF